MVTGPRQIGKTTFLQYCAENSRRYITLDDFNERILANTDPELFFKRNPPPLLIDEVQYAPELFSYIKIICDKERKPGLFWLTGSQKFHLMKNISESLAGRVAILDLLGLSQAEIFRNPCMPILPTNEWIESARHNEEKNFSLMELYKRIWSGSFPQIALNPTIDRDLFYSSYVQTYIQRDVKDIAAIRSESGFYTMFQIKLDKCLRWARLRKRIQYTCAKPSPISSVWIG